MNIISKYNFLSFLLLAFFCYSISSAQSVRDVFLNAPEEIFPFLSVDTRKMMLEEFDQKNSKNEQEGILNNLMSRSRIDYISPQNSLMKIQLDSKTELAFTLLQWGKNEQIILVVKSSMIVPKQSLVQFYSLAWNELPYETFLSAPSYKDFLKENYEDLTQREKMEIKQLLEQMGTFTSHYALKLDKDSHPYIEMEISSLSFLQGDNEEKAHLFFVSEPIVLLWNSKRGRFSRSNH